ERGVVGQETETLHLRDGIENADDRFRAGAGADGKEIGPSQEAAAFERFDAWCETLAPRFAKRLGQDEPLTSPRAHETTSTPSSLGNRSRLWEVSSKRLSVLVKNGSKTSIERRSP